MFSEKIKNFMGKHGTKNGQQGMVKRQCLLTLKENFTQVGAMFVLKKLWILLLPLLVTACVSSGTVRPMSATAKLKTIRIVAVEPPPLEVIPDLLQSRSPVYRHYDTMSVLPYSEHKLYRNPAGILIAGQVAPDDDVEIVSLQKASLSLAPVYNRAVAMTGQSKWTPTFELASTAAEYLRNNSIQASVSEHYLPLPVNSASLSQWHNAVERWYADETPRVDYRPFLTNQVDAVMEIGISRYRIFEGQFSLEVLIKVIDPNTGRLLAKTKQTDYSLGSSAQALLSSDGRAFKAALRRLGDSLLDQELQQIGLVPGIHKDNKSHVAS